MPATLSQLHQQINTLTPQEIDEQIIANIEKATAENAEIWTCPDFNRREYVHSFFQYPAMMIPAVQRKLIEIITEASPGISNMLDPFLGSATTFVASMESGLNCYGQDINPLAVLIAKTRTGPYYTEKLTASYKDLLIRVANDKSVRIETKFENRNKWFKGNILIELSKLVRAIRKEQKLEFRRFFWVVLAETIRVSSNDRTSTFKLHIRKQADIDKRTFSAIVVFQLHMEQSIEDFFLHSVLLDSSNQLHAGKYKAAIGIKLGDSKTQIFAPSNQPFYDILVTSPPYGDNKTTVTYGQHSFLPLQWIDLNDIDPLISQDILKSASEIDTRSLGGKTRVDKSGHLEELFNRSATFKNTYNSIYSKSPRLVKKVVSFIQDLDKTLDNVFMVMKPDSYQIWTIGNRCVAKTEIPNDEILIELIQNKGGVLVTQLKREILNKRMAKRNKEAVLMNNEDILIFRKLGRE